MPFDIAAEGELIKRLIYDAHAVPIENLLAVPRQLDVRDENPIDAGVRLGHRVH